MRSAIAILVGSCAVAPLAMAGPRIDFARDVRPLLAEHCLECQLYFESGFPHGQDQWISAAATNWAAMALAPAVAPVRMARR